MGKTYILFFTMLLSIVISGRGDLDDDKNWILDALGHPKVAQLQLYAQDILSGPVPTNVVVASANSTSSSPTSFGLVVVIDDPVRTAPTPNADIVGRAQGLFASVSLQELTVEMTFDIVFVGGAYNGSSLSVVGHSSFFRPSRELSIVGGTGTFKLARGFIGVRTVFFNSTTNDAFFEYNITVIHY